MEVFAAAFAALYAAHHVGDYWVQTDHQAQHKGAVGVRGARACLAHVATYTLTQAAFLCLILPLGDGFSVTGVVAALLLSAVTHYAADRREHGIMLRLVRLLPGKASLIKLGVPRSDRPRLMQWCDRCAGAGWSGVGAYAERCTDCLGQGATPAAVQDNPSLGTGAWALDQSWHIALGVFLPAVLVAAL